MVYRLIIFTLILLSSATASFNAENIKTFKANFIQTVTNESGKSIEYKGEVYIKNSGKVLWKYFEPIIKNVYLVDDMVVVDEPELEQAIYSRLEKSIDILKLIKDAIKVDENLYESDLYERKYLIGVKDQKISTLSYKDELENKVLIKFENIVQNSSLEDEIFHFIAPAQYDIIEK